MAKKTCNCFVRTIISQKLRWLLQFKPLHVYNYLSIFHIFFFDSLTIQATANTSHSLCSDSLGTSLVRTKNERKFLNAAAGRPVEKKVPTTAFAFVNRKNKFFIMATVTLRWNRPNGKRNRSVYVKYSMELLCKFNVKHHFIHENTEAYNLHDYYWLLYPTYEQFYSI